MLRGVLEAQAPPKQNATDTISTLSSRLTNATLLEDRRGAILGLRSFAKQYPASVASGALRGLISALTKDVEDVDTGKVVLETLLMLFNPNANSPEASDDIALWLADEFSQRQDNITVLLDLLETSEFYCRLYSLQLLLAISSARPERTQECILSAPLGTARLVATLDDSREAIRTAGLLLLNEITQASPELQKIVAFENTFDRIFNLIIAEGSLAAGGIVVQECLTLLANLLNLNASNQSLFRETGFVGRLSKLLTEDAKTAAENGGEGLRADAIRDKNIWGLLAVLRMFLVQGSVGTPANQITFEKQGILQLVLNLGFDKSVGPPIRAEALSTCADIIRGNGKIQERFAHNKVLSPLEVSKEAQTKSPAEKIYIIDALLNMTLSVPTISMFDVRSAAGECIQAYFFNHTGIRHHFLRRAIEGHTGGDDETSNVLSILINGPRNYQSSDPYRLWFAARITFELLYEDAEAKKMTMAIKEGDAENGEEVVTCIQTITGNLITSLQNGDDDRICAGYLMLLCGWLFDDADAVNDFLGEGSTVQSLIQVTSRPGKGLDMVQGLCAVLLGILYEFSTKDSPIPRRTLQPLLISGLGRDGYRSRISRLRQLPMVRDFEVIPQNLSSTQPGNLPEVYFDQAFVNFLKDNFNRLIRAIDRDPGKEVLRLQEGVDRDLVDSLRAQIEDKAKAVEKAHSDLIAMERILGQEQADHRRSKDSSKAELQRIKNINEALQKGHEAEAAKSDAEHRMAVQQMQNQHQRQAQDLERRGQQIAAETVRQAETAARQHGSELASLNQRLKMLEVNGAQAKETIDKFQRASRETAETLRQRDEQIVGMQKDVQHREAQATALRNDIQQRGGQITQLKATLSQRDTYVQTLQDAITANGAELTELRTTIHHRDTQLTSIMEDLQQRDTQIDNLTSEVQARTFDLVAAKASTTQAEASLQSRLKEQTVLATHATEKETEMRKQLQEKEESRSAAQTELDDLLIVLQDLEEKRTRDKKKLKELGAEVSDLDDDDEDDNDGDDDDAGDAADGEEAEADEEQAKKTDGNTKSTKSTENGNDELD